MPLDGTSIYAAWRSPHRRAGFSPPNPAIMPLDGTSIYAAWRSPQRRAGFSPPNPVITPLDGTSIYAAWRPPHRRAGFSPPNPVITPLDGTSVYAAWRSPHRRAGFSPPGRHSLLLHSWQGTEGMPPSGVNTGLKHGQSACIRCLMSCSIQMPAMSESRAVALYQ